MSGFCDSEQRKVENAWNLAETAPNAHLLSAIRSVSKGDGIGGASASGSHVTIDKALDSSKEEIASAFIHEAAHCHYRHASSTPATEREAVLEENQARARFGLSRKNPDDFSWHAANGFAQVADNPGPDGSLRIGEAVITSSNPQPHDKPELKTAWGTPAEVHTYWADLVASGTLKGGELASAVYNAHGEARENARRNGWKWGW